jgi:hypothetical protein
MAACGVCAIIPQFPDPLSAAVFRNQNSAAPAATLLAASEKEASKRSTAFPAKRLSSLKKCASRPRQADNFLAGGESRAILVSSVGDGSKRRRPPWVRLQRGRQRFGGQVVEIAARAVKQSLDEP